MNPVKQLYFTLSLSMFLFETTMFLEASVHADYAASARSIFRGENLSQCFESYIVVCEGGEAYYLLSVSPLNCAICALIKSSQVKPTPGGREASIFLPKPNQGL